MLGFAAFAVLRGKRESSEPVPSTLREAGLPEPREPEPVERLSAAPSDVGPLSERSPEFLELDLEFESDQQLARESVHDSVAPEDLGAHFLARATDALSPFGGTFEQFDLDQFGMESGPLSEASARAANDQDTFEPRADDDDIAESERRPMSLRVGVRS
jgi:hypothetical protein